jgi:hypothetical protein
MLLPRQQGLKEYSHVRVVLDDQHMEPWEGVDLSGLDLGRRGSTARRPRLAER